MPKSIVRAVAVTALVLALVLAAATPAAARVIHKSTKDLWGVHIAVVLEYTGRPLTPLYAFCSLSGNSQVLKRIEACGINSGSATNPTPVDSIDGPTQFSGENRALSLSVAPWCDRNYSAWIEYRLRAPNGESYWAIGRTLYRDAC